MKKIIAILLALVTLFTLCACNKDTTPTQTPSTPTQTPSTSTATPPAFALDRETYVLFVREKLLLTPTVSSGTTWESSDSKIASVKDGGVVTAVAKGNVEITATSKNGEKSVCKIKVIDPTDYFTLADLSTLKLTSLELKC